MGFVFGRVCVLRVINVCVCVRVQAGSRRCSGVPQPCPVAFVPDDWTWINRFSIDWVRGLTLSSKQSQRTQTKTHTYERTKSDW